MSDTPAVTISTPERATSDCSINNDTNNTYNFNIQLQHRNTNITLSNLQNRYWVVRHGQSEANVQKIISSHPDISTKFHGLSSVGKEEAKRAGKVLATELLLVPTTTTTTTTTTNTTTTNRRNVVVISSDYLRAKETAEIVVKELRKQAVLLSSVPENNIEDVIHLRYDTRLRERGFGRLHGTSDTNYQKVWEHDQKDAHHTEWDVESVSSVLCRTTQLLLELEKEFSTPTIIILIAHGDVLQILQTAFASIHPSLHRTLPHLPTATPRELSSILH